MNINLNDPYDPEITKALLKISQDKIEKFENGEIQRIETDKMIRFIVICIVIVSLIALLTK